MPLRKIIGLSFAAVCLTAVSWYAATLAFAWMHPPAEPPKPTDVEVSGLRIPIASLELGEVWENDAHKVTLPITNASGKDVRVMDLLAGCTCTEVEPRSFSLKAGESRTVNLTIDMTKRGPWERHSELRVCELPVRPVIEGGGLPKEAWLVGLVVRSRITIDTDELVFGDRLAARSVNDPRRLEARVFGDRPDLMATVLPADAGTTTAKPLGEGRFSVSVVPSATLPQGPFSFTVELSVRGDELGVIRRFKAKGVLGPEVRAFPARVFLGQRAIGTTATTTVQLQAPPGTGWEVERIESDSAEVKVTSERGSYRIEQAVIKEGDQSATVRFFVRMGKAAPVQLTTVVSCFGLRGEKKP